MGRPFLTARGFLAVASDESGALFRSALLLIANHQIYALPVCDQLDVISKTLRSVAIPLDGFLSNIVIDAVQQGSFFLSEVLAQKLANILLNQIKIM